MKKVVLKLELNDEKIRKKAMTKVSGITGVESVAIDTKDKKLTVVGDIDPVDVVAKLRKLCPTDMVSVGPAKEPEKKKDESNKKDDQSKKGGDEKKKEGGDEKKTPLVAYQYQQHYLPLQPYQYHHYPPPAPAYNVRSVEEDPNSCVIC